MWFRPIHFILFRWSKSVPLHSSHTCGYGKGRLQPGEQPSLHRRGISVASVDGPWSLTMGKEVKILLVGLCPVKDSCEGGELICPKF